MRRPAPRPLRLALEQAAAQAAPADSLARLQAAWPELVGPVVAAEAEPAAEREGVVTVRCTSAVWAHELELLAPDLLPRIGALLGEGAVRELRFSAGGRARP